MIEVELERSFLVKKFPEGFRNLPRKEIIDTYIPAEDRHPVVRIRKNGDKFEITKKQPIAEADSSEQTEHTIKLSKEEFGALSPVKGKRSRRVRYLKDYGEAKMELDVFQDDLAGLVIADFEFKDKATKDNFKMPDFCLVEITEEELFADGMLAGAGYGDSAKRLSELGYIKISP
ncbi:hypothetical protein KGQ31_01630 [Patescibacteria group bacterium]|nr:hypothetical protein [Patescibacteria group bacterium]